jgi:putative transposase
LGQPDPAAAARDVLAEFWIRVSETADWYANPYRHVVAVLREADRTSVAEAAKKNKISEQTVYSWRKHFNGLEPNDVKRLKALEGENAKLKRLLAERDLEIDLMRQVNRKKW